MFRKGDDREERGHLFLLINKLNFFLYCRNPMGRSHTRNNRKVQSSPNTGGIISKVGNNIEPNNNDHVNTAKKNSKCICIFIFMHF